MNDQKGMSNTKIFVLAIGIVLLLLILLVAMNQQKRLAPINKLHQQALTDVVNAIRHVNEVVLTQEPSGNYGVHYGYVGAVPLSLMNDKLRATQASLENGLDISKQLLSSPHADFERWNMVKKQSEVGKAERIKLIPKGASEHCYVIYIEAGTYSQPRNPQYLIIDKGC